MTTIQYVGRQDANAAGTPFEAVRLQEIDLNITNRCNLNCIHCAFASSITDNNELPFPVIKSIVDDAVTMGCRDIHLTGGEPTIHRQFPSVLEYILRSGVFCRLISNGVTPAANLRRWREMGLGHVLFSLDGLAANHDRIRGRLGLFNKTMKTAEDALALGFNVRINAVAMRNNLDDIVPLFERCEQLGVQTFSVFLYSPTGRNARNQFDLLVDARRWRTLKLALRARSAGSSTRVFVERGFIFEGELQDGWSQPQGRGGGCNYLARVMDYLIITGDGNVFPCALLNDKSIPYGNVYDRPLRQILEKPAHFDTYRGFQQADGKCRSCDAVDRCHGGCRAFAYALNGRWTEPDPQCEWQTGRRREYMPVCPLQKESLNGAEVSGFSENLS